MYIYINKKILSIELIFLLKEIHKTYSKSLGHVGGCPAPNFKCLIKCEFLISSCHYELIYKHRKMLISISYVWITMSKGKT